MSTLMQPESISAVRRQFMRALATFDAHAAVFEVVSERLQKRLDVLAVEPLRVLDLGCRTGYQLQALAERYPNALIVGADPAPGRPPQLPGAWPRWLQRSKPAMRCLACDPAALPFPAGSFDLVVSNLLLPWCREPHRVFEEVCRVLNTNGAFMFTSAGPDTLVEYRRLWASVDAHLHSFGLIDMHDLGDAMLAAGFAAPVLDRDNLTVDYPSVSELQAELRALGAMNLASGRRHALMGSGAEARLMRQAEANSQTDSKSNSRFKVTLELVQGHGWKGNLPQVRNDSGEVRVSVDMLRGRRRRGTT